MKKRRTGGRSPSALRALNTPTAIQVQIDEDGRPVRIRSGGHLLQVASVRAMWRIDDEWWRHLISRWYFTLVLENGKLLTVYRDLRSRRWFTQPSG